MLADAATQWEPVLQYGAFGLCVILCIGFYFFAMTLLRTHREERLSLVNELRRNSIELGSIALTGQRALDNNTAALARMTEALGDRPCMASDSRVKQMSR